MSTTFDPATNVYALINHIVAMPPPRATRLRKLLAAWSRDGRAYRCTEAWQDGQGRSAVLKGA